MNLFDVVMSFSWTGITKNLIKERLLTIILKLNPATSKKDRQDKGIEI